jgi:hypothetical protein
VIAGNLMRSLLSKGGIALSLLTASGIAAADFTPIPEPGILELAGIGAAVAIAFALAKRRK